MSHNRNYIKLINCTKWKRIRTDVLKQHPTCEQCSARGHKAIPATCVHHIIPVEITSDEKEMERLAYDFSNLQSLCRQCHKEIHYDMKFNRKEARKTTIQIEMERLSSLIAFATQYDK